MRVQQRAAGDSDEHILLVDFQTGGHNPNFVQWLVEYWIASRVAARLTVLVTPAFAAAYPNIVALAQGGSEQVRFVTPTEAEDPERWPRGLEAALSRWPFLRRHARSRLKRLSQWRLVGRLVRELHADHCLFLNFDFYQQMPAAGMQMPCRFSGIYHNLLLHYGSRGRDLTLKERARGMGQRWMVDRVLHNRSLHTLFCLDPYAAEYIRERNPGSNVVHLPTPARPVAPSSPAERERLRAALQIDPGRRVFLMFGGIRQRKGIDQVLESLCLLPDEIARRVCLLLVGRHENGEALRTEALRIEAATPVQIVSRDAFVPEQELGAYFDLADVALAAHPRHVGVSMTLVHAAQAGKPVFASDFGLIGQLVRSNRLGLAVRAGSPEAIAEGFRAFVAGDSRSLFDPEASRAFGRKNTAERYAQTIVQHLISEPFRAGCTERLAVKPEL